MEIFNTPNSDLELSIIQVKLSRTDPTLDAYTLIAASADMLLKAENLLRGIAKVNLEAMKDQNIGKALEMAFDAGSLIRNLDYARHLALRSMQDLKGK